MNKIKTNLLPKKLIALIMAFAIIASTAISLGFGFSSVSASADTASTYSYPYYYLEITPLEKSGGRWRLRVYNTNPSAVEVEYNTKMCNSGDAMIWELKNVIAMEIAGNSYRDIYVSTNGTAKHFGFSYIDRENDVRLISYPQASGSTLIPKFTYIEYLSACLLIKVVTTGWTVDIINPLDRGVYVEYNKKMCNRSDAVVWNKNLKDPGYLDLCEGGKEQRVIPKNGTATSIAVSYVEGKYRYITVAYNISEAFLPSIKTLKIEDPKQA